MMIARTIGTVIKMMVLAQTSWAVGEGNINIPNPIGTSNFADVVANIAKALSTLAIPIVGVMVVYGGLQMMTAGGKPEQFSSGKKTIVYAVVGYAVILLAESVTGIIADLVNPTPTP